MSPMLKIVPEMLQYGTVVLRLGKTAFAWRKGFSMRKGKAEEKQRKQAEKRHLRLLWQEVRRQRGKIAVRRAKRWGRVVWAVRRKYF